MLSFSGSQYKSIEKRALPLTFYYWGKQFNLYIEYIFKTNFIFKINCSFKQKRVLLIGTTFLHMVKYPVIKFF